MAESSFLKMLPAHCVTIMQIACMQIVCICTRKTLHVRCIYDIIITIIHLGVHLDLPKFKCTPSYLYVLTNKEAGGLTTDTGVDILRLCLSSLLLLSQDHREREA